MNRMLITTVGTSLLTNRNRPWSGWKGWEGDPLPQESDVDEWLAQADRSEASAETNTLHAMQIEPSDHILFLCSDTIEGRFCAERLRHFIIHAVHCLPSQVKSRSVTSLGYSDAGFSQRGLKGLVSEAVKAVSYAREHRQHLTPIFCATGGFKAEIAFLNLLGALLEVEVYYIHERFREIVRLPRLPLRWDAQWVLQHQDFFEWIDEEPRRSIEVQSWLKARPALQSLVEDAEDGFSYLNAAGNLLFKAAKEQFNLKPPLMWPEPVMHQPHEKDKISSEEHHRPRGWKRFVDQLCRISWVSQVRYDKSILGNAKVKVVDAANGTIGAQYSVDDKVLPLRVETTAQGEDQTKLVSDYIHHLLYKA